MRIESQSLYECALAIACVAGLVMVALYNVSMISGGINYSLDRTVHARHHTKSPHRQNAVHVAAQWDQIQ